MKVEPRAWWSVNWTTGMLLTPEHFVWQDQFADASAAWALRFCLGTAGLVGGGARVNREQAGLAQHDPLMRIEDNGYTVSIAVLRARGLSPLGEPVEVSEDHPVRLEIAKTELTAARELLVSVGYTHTTEEESASLGLDEANPNQVALRRPRYELMLGAPADLAAHALVVGRMRRAAETLAWERDGGFIPPCAMVLAHSALYAGWSRLRDEVVYLAGRFAELHRSAARYAAQIAERGVDVTPDHEILAFVERATLALDACAYEILDPAAPPARPFQQVDRLGRGLAVALDLSSSTRLFLRSLVGADADYDVLLEEERRALARGRELDAREDLRVGLDRASQTVDRIRRLCEALEGKYLDFRINPTVDALRFLLEDAGERFYVAVATPNHPQREGDLLTFDFAPLNLPAAHEYRVLLVGDGQGRSPWQLGESLEVDLRLNPNAGVVRPLSRTLHCQLPGQRHFAVDFDPPPEISTLASLRVTVHSASHRIRRAVLYRRTRGIADAAPVPPAPYLAAEPPTLPPANAELRWDGGSQADSVPPVRRISLRAPER